MDYNSWNSPITIAIVGGIWALVAAIAPQVVSFLFDRHKKHEKEEEERKNRDREVEKRVIAEQKAKHSAKELKITKKHSSKYEKLMEKCEREKGQLEIILRWHDFVEEERKQLIDTKVPPQEWVKKDEVKNKLNEIGKKQERCKNCDHCNNPLTFLFST